MGGMSGSYSNLALFPDTTKYIFAWQSRGALDLAENAWLGTPYTQCSPRWLNHNVAIATMSDKNTLTGAEASSTVGAHNGDGQVNWITYSTTEDHQNVHVATLNPNLALVTWETLTNFDCQPVPLGCSGTYAGTSFQFVDSTGAKVGSPTSSTSFFVSGDIANVGTNKVCWPYVDMTWDLSQPLASGTPVSKMSFACASSGDSTAGTASSPSSSSSSSSSPSSPSSPSPPSPTPSTSSSPSSSSSSVVSSTGAGAVTSLRTHHHVASRTFQTITIPTAPVAASRANEYGTCVW
jgi:hypothetical protein